MRRSLERSRNSRGFTLLELLVVLCILAVLVAILLPLRRTAGPAARQSQCRNHLRNIAIGLHEYHEVYQAFPPAYTVDADGKPLHSWRTLLLPYLDQQSLYDKIDLTQPWDAPVNADAFQSAVYVYSCPAGKPLDNRTTYLAIIAPHSALRPRASCGMADIRDEAGHTALVIEVDRDHAVPWMSPQDADEALLLSQDAKAKLSHPNGFHAVFADGSVKFLNAKMDSAGRRSMMTIDGRDSPTETP